MKSRNWFMGVLFIAIGVVALLSTLGVIDFSWRIVWKLWPMILVLIGIVVLPVKDWLKAVLVLAALAVGVLLYQNEANKRSFNHVFSQSVRKEAVELAIS